MVQVARFKWNQRTRWGVLEGAHLRPLAESYATTRELLLNGADDIAGVSASHGAERVALSEVDILSPITENQQVLCQGANYRKHMLESGMDPDSKGFNMLFRKASSCLCGATDPIRKPNHVQLLDYEVELGLVLGRDVTEPHQFSGADLPDVVSALVIHNDVSARDVQVPQMQFYKGKSYRTFGPTGPYLTIVDDKLRAGWRSLRLQLKVNGELRQNELADDMLFEPAQTLTELSHLQSLRAGDLIATGTPAGVAMQLPPPWLVRLIQLVPERRKWAMFVAKQRKSGRYLQIDDLVECSIASDDGTADLGRLSNRVQHAAKPGAS